jgi:hypothetical protein
MGFAPSRRRGDSTLRTGPATDDRVDAEREISSPVRRYLAV